MRYIVTPLKLVEKKGEEILVVTTLSIMASCVFAQVVARYIFHTAITWTEELSGFCMVWSVYLGASLAVKERFHFRILVTLKIVPKALRKFIVIIGDLFWLLFCILMLVYCYEYLTLLWTRVYISQSLGIDQKWAEMIIFWGYLLMALRLLQIYYQWFKGGMEGIPGVRPEDL